jgi:hypothetical protein
MIRQPQSSTHTHTAAAAIAHRKRKKKLKEEEEEEGRGGGAGRKKGSCVYNAAARGCISLSLLLLHDTHTWHQGLRYHDDLYYTH